METLNSEYTFVYPQEHSRHLSNNDHTATILSTSSKTKSTKMSRSLTWAHVSYILLLLLICNTTFQWLETGMSVAGMHVPSIASRVEIGQMRLRPYWTPLPRLTAEDANDQIMVSRRSLSHRSRNRIANNDHYGIDEVEEEPNINGDSLKKTIERQATALFDDENALSRMIQQMDAYYLTYGRPRYG
ncbi:hypothetical protein D915_003842 [Fasciola hepatica]|uniref:Uncharacterized protein n=1 Tax=Fasciola hepatica TaxID=6192 RepID=A0A4E0RCX6_FASHE|nr:hypothetical protein D915_003842 [Fasciola hepatica]